MTGKSERNRFMNVILLTVLALGGTGGEVHVAVDAGVYADDSEYAGGWLKHAVNATLRESNRSRCSLIGTCPGSSVSGLV